MKCQYCGNELSDGAVYCDRCGKPVQIVPDYNVFEDDVLPSMVSEEKKKEAAEIAAQGPAEKKETEDGKPPVQTGKRVSKKTMVLCCIALAALALILSLSFYLNTPAYQKGAGDRACESGNYTAAVSHYTNAFSVHDTDASLAASLGAAYAKLADNENAEKYYRAALAIDRENETAYAGLCDLYVATQNYEGLAALKEEAATEAQQKAIEGAYISEVAFSEEGGDYEDDVDLLLTSPEGYSIYYTTDGKDPDPVSAVLFADGEPIELTEGDTLVKARAVSDSGSLGPVTEEEYKISYAAPDYPRVSPDGGDFSSPTQVTMSYSQDEEAKIYYTWDGSDPTAASTLYTGPVTVPEGNNVLSVIVVDSHDLSSNVYRCNFVYLPAGGESPAAEGEARQ